MAAVDGFGWVQGNGGGISQSGRFNASAMAEEDAWETVNFVLFMGFVFVYELAGARSLFGEGGSVARPERGPWRGPVASVVSSGPSEDGYKEEGRPRRLSLNQRCYNLLQK
jgi:hypothetical protein